MPTNQHRRGGQRSALAHPTWLETRRDRIEVFYLPVHAPELNPDELLNSDLSVLHAGLPARNKAELTQKARSHLHRLQKRPAHIQRYFQHPKITYAAAP